MKVGTNSFLRGRPLSLILASLLATTLLLWLCEKNPFSTTLSVTQELFANPTVGFVEVSPNSSLSVTKANENVEEKDIQISIIEEMNGNEEISVAGPVGSPPEILSEMQKSKRGNGEEDKSSAGLVGSPPEFISEMQKSEGDVPSFSTNKVCNFAKGRWVADSERPLYSGFDCKQWLSEMWACRLTQRIDFSYERYRWQPENCETLKFERSSFLRRLLSLV